ncbi:DNA polymerase III subunit psi [Vibrio paucivorans]|uniref:DNA polymerase III subunit psi n=1 Tax=Vibrio paucivorans TaxID=2829489 RepID=A0A9X3CJB7_9VIBR|nr:DNA polymerase III subunit psi [Vibrio paucivorans]MCW8336705.1 DNA polymerase III subunit psi [Vibrio paucivorans]
MQSLQSNQQHSAYLEEMGISQWTLVHPERLSGYQLDKAPLEESCKLLLVSPVCPEAELAEMFERVLKSIKLDLTQAQHVTPENLAVIGEHQLEWIWFAGCERVDGVTDKVLTSPLLSDIDGNNEQRRLLWQQICSY